MAIAETYAKLKNEKKAVEYYRKVKHPLGDIDLTHPLLSLVGTHAARQDCARETNQKGSRT